MNALCCYGTSIQGSFLLTMVSRSFKTASHWNAKRVFPALFAVFVLPVLLAFSSPKTAAAQSSQLTREQLAIIFMLLRDSMGAQVSHQQTHRGSRHLRIKCNFSCNGDCRCFPPVAAGYLNNVRVLCKEGCEEKFTAETEQMLSRYEPALEFG